MSLYDYEESQAIYSRGYSFDALIMAAMRGADSANFELLQIAFPLVCQELKARYNAPGGILPGEERSATR